MTKSEFIEILKQLNISFNEGASSINNSTKYPRLVFWDYLWEFKVASNKKYVTVKTYQVSFFAKKPDDPKLLELVDLLLEHEIYPTIQHEWVEDKGKDLKYQHSFFSVELIDD